MDLPDVGVDGASVLQFEIELEHLQEIPLRFGKRACFRQQVVDVVEIDVFGGGLTACVRFRLAAKVMELIG